MPSNLRRIVSWNINSIRTRVDQVIEWAGHADADVLLLQETKCGDADFPFDAFDAAREIAVILEASPRFGELGEYGRIAVNVDTVYRSLDPDHETPDVVEQFRRMAELEAH